MVGAGFSAGGGEAGAGVTVGGDAATRSGAGDGGASATVDDSGATRAGAFAGVGSAVRAAGAGLRAAAGRSVTATREPACSRRPTRCSVRCPSSVSRRSASSTLFRRVFGPRQAGRRGLSPGLDRRDARCLRVNAGVDLRDAGVLDDGSRDGPHGPDQDHPDQDRGAGEAGRGQGVADPRCTSGAGRSCSGGSSSGPVNP